MTEALEQWLGREYRHAATAMLRSVSARDIVKKRPGFGQTVRPVAGSKITYRPKKPLIAVFPLPNRL